MSTLRLSPAADSKAFRAGNIKNVHKFLELLSELAKYCSHGIELTTTQTEGRFSYSIRHSTVKMIGLMLDVINDREVESIEIDCKYHIAELIEFNAWVRLDVVFRSKPTKIYCLYMGDEWAMNR